MYFSGSFLVFDKQVFIDAGSFDENIFLFHEEADISNRILALGKQTVLAHDIFVLHLVHGREQNLYLMKVGAESREYYFNKYRSNLSVYYKNYLILCWVKYIVAFILRDKYQMSHLHPWIKMCKNKGILCFCFFILYFLTI